MPTAGRSAAMPPGFWEFSVRTYGRPGVAEACLLLQNRNGADVNMLMFAAWYGLRAGAMPAPVLARALAFSQLWSARAVKPLREIRSWMKIEGRAVPDMPDDTCMALRERVKAVELAAEKLQQEALAAIAGTPPAAAPADGKAQAAANIRAYAASAGLMLDGAPLAVLLAAVDPAAASA